MADEEKKFGFEDDLNQYMEYAQQAKQYEGFLQQAESAKSLEKLVAKSDPESGDKIKLVDENDPRYQQAVALQKAGTFYAAKAASKVKSDLGSIVNNSDKNKLISLVARAASHKAGDDKLKSLFGDYALYHEFFHPQKDKNGNLDEERRHYIENEVIKKKLPGIIKKRVEKAYSDPKEAEIQAGIISAFKTGEYIADVVKGEIERIENELSGKSSSDLANYIGANLQKDEEYVAFASNLYAMHNAEENKK